MDTPAPGWPGDDSFTYTADNGSSTANVSIMVNPVHDNPVVVNDSSSVNEGATVNINLAANDTDVWRSKAAPAITGTRSVYQQLASRHSSD